MITRKLDTHVNIRQQVLLNVGIQITFSLEAIFAFIYVFI